MDDRKSKLIDPDFRRRHLGGNKSICFWRVRTCRYFGYLRRRTAATGYWYARVNLAGGGVKSTRIAIADDVQPADGKEVMTFYQALNRAEEWFKDQEAVAAPDQYLSKSPDPLTELPPAPPYTVSHAVAEYLRWKRRYDPSVRSPYTYFKNHVLDQLGHVALQDLTAVMLTSWLHDLAEKPKIVSFGRLQGVRYGELPKDPEAVRRRQNSANRVFSLLKAALKLAFARGHVDTDKAWRPVKPFKGAVRSHIPKCLSRPEVTRLIAACPDEIADVVKVGLVTGCRISDILKMRVSDYLPKAGRVEVYASKTRKLVLVALSIEGIELFDRLVVGRSGNELLFKQPDGQPWSYRTIMTPFLRYQRQAGIRPTIKFTQLRHTYASNAVMAGLPMKAIASQLGHANTSMVDLYYGHLLEDYLTQEVRQKMPRFFTQAPLQRDTVT